MVKVVSPFKTTKWNVGSKEDPTLKRTLTLQAKTAIVVALVLFIVMLTVVLVCLFLPQGKDASWMPEYVSDSPLERYQSAAVSTDAAPCATIAKDILFRGGSVIDAAIAALVCMGANNPESMGLGGGFLMMYYNRTQRTAYYVDSREVAPKNASKDMFNGNATATKSGGLAIAVPGELAGYSEIHNEFGRLHWKDLIQPTIELCRSGLKMHKHLATALREYQQQIEQLEPFRKVFINNKTGRFYQEGDFYTRPDLADTLEAIAEYRTEAIYGPSELSKRFLEDLKAAGSWITEEDLTKYSPRMLMPVKKILKGNLTLHTTSPPGSGALLALILGILEGYDLNPDSVKTKEGAILTIHRMIEAFKFAYARRMDMQDDLPEIVQKLVDELTSQKYADEIRSKIDDKKTYNDPGHYGVNVTIQKDHGTSSICIMGPDGDAVAVTSTINTYFGSLVMSPSTGIILNNEMDDFSSPYITNFFGVPPTIKNNVHPGRRPFSSMSPSIITDSNGNVRLVVGGNGGTQITTSVAQTIIRNLWLKENIKMAIDAPRFHHQLLPNVVYHEVNFPKDLMDALTATKGHEFHDERSSLLGIVLGISREDDGYLYANSDYRKGGLVNGF